MKNVFDTNGFKILPVLLKEILRHPYFTVLVHGLTELLINFDKLLGY